MAKANHLTDLPFYDDHEKENEKNKRPLEATNKERRITTSTWCTEQSTMQITYIFH